MKYRIFRQNKLWRDKCVQILEELGSRINWRRLNDAEFDCELRSKMIEEVHEVAVSTSRQELLLELADVYEVIDSLCQLNNITKEEIITAQANKREQKGGF